MKRAARATKLLRRLLFGERQRTRQDDEAAVARALDVPLHMSALPGQREALRRRYGWTQSVLLVDGRRLRSQLQTILTVLETEPHRTVVFCSGDVSLCRRLLQCGFEAFSEVDDLPERICAADLVLSPDCRSTLLLCRAIGTPVLSIPRERGEERVRDWLAKASRGLPYSTATECVPGARDVRKVAMVLDAFVGPRAVVCGITKNAEAWIRDMAAQGIDVVIFSPFSSSEIEAYFGQRASVRGGRVTAYQLDAHVLRYGPQTYRYTKSNARNAQAVFRALREERPDVVHTIFDANSIPLFGAVSALLDIPVVGVLHTDTSVVAERNGIGFLGPVLTFGQRMFGLSLTGTATTSPSFAGELWRKRRWRMDHTLRPQVDTQIFRPVQSEAVLRLRKKLTFSPDSEELTFCESSRTFSDRKFLMLYAGRLDVDKRIDELMALMKMLEVEKDIHLALVGGGALAADLCRRHGPQTRIFCHPEFVSHEELCLYYNAADIHISASQMETLGNTALESMACGTPVVVPKAQGFVSTVAHGETGLLWDPGRPDASREMVEKLRWDSSLLARLGRCAATRMQEMDCTSAVRDQLDWYRQLVEEKRARPRRMRSLLAALIPLVVVLLGELIILPLCQRLLGRSRTEAIPARTPVNAGRRRARWREPRERVDSRSSPPLRSLG